MLPCHACLPRQHYRLRQELDHAAHRILTTSDNRTQIHSLPRPLLDRVLVQRIKADTRTAGGIFLPESSVKELNEAKVLAVGPGGFDKEGKRIAMGVIEGDKGVDSSVWRQSSQGRRRRVSSIQRP